ncbi:transcriptional regulator, LytTR family [Sphingomonas guangdongensis]|uniref:Transcriptional regulator, LytTR family n=1 Tax=Sphingomonas guangdongensis TaxID=1141890 RepID=A0A285QC88_9SPHN|nr:LytTR family DNA-binding domain-containing protein [Sphingomonas guangdongensis]SOB79104.1 transcriptional regulator, LytTR family [Sphingomonas guangdongensis]
MRDFAKLQAQRWLLGVAGRAGLAVLFAALLAFLAPFGTYRFRTVELIGYWTIQMAAWLVLSQVVTWILAQLPAMRARSVVQQRIAAVILAALPMMVVTGIANNMISGWQPEPSEVAELFVSITLIGGAYTFLADWLMTDMLDAHAEPTSGSTALPFAVPDVAGDGASDAAAADNALIDRLPPHIRSDILCLQVEDHYVRVHGHHSSAMVLMRFSDALRGINHLPGAQVHRSWWVATGAVTALRRNGRTAQLTLSNGTAVPVSQPYLAFAVRTWGGLAAAAD